MTSLRLRLFVALGAVGCALAALAFILLAAPTSAAGVAGSTHDTTQLAAPPAQGPTLVAETPEGGPSFPPFDLGALGEPQTPTPTPQAEPEGEVVIDQPFDECKPIDDQYINIECMDGEMRFTRKDAQGTRWIYYRPVVGDAMIEFTARLPSQKNAHYGVIFRMDPDQNNFYIMGVTNDGKYGLFRFVEDHYETIIPYTDSLYVGNASFPSKVKLVNQGDTIAINIGGSWVDSVRDDNLKQGQVALFFEPDEPNQTVLFDDLKVTKLNAPVDVPTPREVVQPTATATSGNLPVFSFPTDTPVPAGPTTAPATQTPFIIIVTATPLPATAVPTRAPTRAPTRTPTEEACGAPGNEAWLIIRNGYPGQMRFTIGGGAWGTHDYDVPPDNQWWIIKMPPGKYTYTAFIPGFGTAHGERTQYDGGQCYPLSFAPN